MEITNRFSFEDFLAYLIPGMIGTFGILVWPAFAPLVLAAQAETRADLLIVVLFLGFAYGLGFILGGMSNSIIRVLYKAKFYSDPRSSIPQKETRAAIRAIASDILHIAPDVPWTSEYFYLCRALVQNKMPLAYETITRQNALRQMGENLIPMVLIWIATGFAWSVQVRQAGSAALALQIFIGVLAAGIVCLLLLLRNLWNNRHREVREVYAALLAGYRTGMVAGK